MMLKKKVIYCMVSHANLSLACARASVKFGAIVTSIKGKVGGHVFQGGIAGPSFMTRKELIDAVASGSKLTKADAGRVMNPQLGIGQNATIWRDLTDAERQSWSAAAAQFPFKNKFGEPYTGSGYQLYMSCNANLQNYGGDYIRSSPLPTSLIPTNPITITVGVGGSTMVITEWSVINGFRGALFMSTSQSRGRNFDPSALKCIRTFEADNYDGTDIAGDYVNIFGTIPPHGNIWVQARTCVTDAGIIAQPYTAQVIW